MSDGASSGDGEEKRATGGIGCLGELALLGIAVGSFYFGSWMIAAPVAIVCAFLIWRILGWQTAIDRKNHREDQAKLRAIASPNDPDAWRLLLAQHPALLAAVDGKQRDALRLSTTAVDELPLGASRIGGLPDLPDDIPFPPEPGLAFVAQLNLREIPLPPEVPAKMGTLWFFFSFEAFEQEKCRVYFRPDGTPLKRAAPNEKAAPFPQKRIEPRRYVDVPEPSNLTLDDEAAWDHFFTVRQYLATGGAEEQYAPEHKLFGHPNWVQEGELNPGVSLLLQIDSDGSKMMLGDAGKVYFLIDDEDLAAWRFDDVELIAQCH